MNAPEPHALTVNTEDTMDPLEAQAGVIVPTDSVSRMLTTEAVE